MLSEKDILLWQEHYRDLLREAEQARAVRVALAGKTRVRFHERGLARLGSYFVTWGCYLQRRYAFGVAGGGAVSLDSGRVGADCGCTP